MSDETREGREQPHSEHTVDLAGPDPAASAAARGMIKAILTGLLLVAPSYVLWALAHV